MTPSITVYHDGSGMRIFQPVADMHGLRSGQSITTAQFWDLLRDNSAFGIAECSIELAKMDKP